jgi:hypothetical protein
VTSRFRNKKWRIIASVVFGLLVIIIVLVTTPILGGGNYAEISTGTATKGGFYGLHFGAYE